MKIEKPKRIAICLISEDKEIANQQIEQLKDIEKFFSVEWCLRSDKFTGHYNSFSQIINEMVVETDAEFMVFIAKKVVNISVDHILSIIDDLTSGFCFSSIVNFGFFGTTKELFRRIGLMDERFIYGEYEDYDFYLRIKQLNKAINARFEFDKYISYEHPMARGALSKSLFFNKWREIDNVVYKIDKLSLEKQLPQKIKNRHKDYLYQSWNSWEHSHKDHSIQHIFPFINNYDISNDTLKTEQIFDNEAKLDIETKDIFKISFYCNIPTKIIWVLSKKLVDNNIINCFCGHQILYSNTWWKSDFDIINGNYHIEFYHEGNLIFKQPMNIPSEKISINIPLEITKI